ncbi:MAG: hypothetical protein IKR85_10010 [Clostridia bacterium]|nr:hypothetical protein [Clostridia bacterium]
MNLQANLGAGHVILNDYVLSISDIEGGHRLTVSRGSDIQTLDVPDGTQAHTHALSDVNGLSAILSGKQDLCAVRSVSGSALTLSAGESVYVSGTPASLAVTLNAPQAGREYICSLIFRAGADFTLTETAPQGYTVQYDGARYFTAGEVYEVIYRCMWLTDTNDSVIISAKSAQVQHGGAA